jgi:peptidoglycan hydrolase-like protein with peptidoglycan-binding domain
MDALLGSLDNLEEATNEVQQIANDDAQVRVEMEAMMNAILVVITEIQRSLNELEELQDAAEDVAKLKGKIEQNNQKQNELLKKINALKETLQKSPNIRNLQEQLQNLKTNLTNNILDHERLQRRPPGNSPNQTQAQVDDYNADFANSQLLGRPGSAQEMQTFGGYRYSGSSPGKIISNKSRTKTKSKNKKKTRTRRRRI